MWRNWGISQKPCYNNCFLGLDLTRDLQNMKHECYLPSHNFWWFVVTHLYMFQAILKCVWNYCNPIWYRNVTYWYLALGFLASFCDSNREYLTVLPHLVGIFSSCLTPVKFACIAIYRQEICVYTKNHMKFINVHWAGYRFLILKVR